MREGGRGWNCHILCSWQELGQSRQVQSSEEPKTSQVAGTGKGPSPEAVFGHCSHRVGLLVCPGVRSWTDDPSGSLPTRDTL